MRPGGAGRICRLGRADLRFVASHAPLVFPRHERGPAAHRLHAPSLCVQKLEVDGRAGGRLERAGSFRGHLRFAQHVLDIPRAARHRDPLARKVAPIGDEAVERRIPVRVHQPHGDERRTALDSHHAQPPHRAARNTFQSRSLVDVLHMEGTVCRLGVPRHESRRARKRTRPRGYRLGTFDGRIVCQQLALALGVLPVDAEVGMVAALRAGERTLGHEARDPFRLGKRIRILPLRAVLRGEILDVGIVGRAAGAECLVPVVIARHDCAAFAYVATRNEGDAGVPLRAARPVDHDELALLRHMVPSHDSEHLCRAGNLAEVQE